uniref:IRG-type G domain-containing protein n=2 Tax=Gadus morhua TaxID=8049 RepID=A0A8C5C8W4_GADMO
MPYPHPKLQNVTLWDLPGVGTTKFPADKYLEHFKFEHFDFFIIVSADRFTENDAKLAKEITKMGKKFYFVRSKIDHNLSDAERSQRDYNKENKLQQIRKSCIQGLEALGMTSPRVFLVSSFDLHLYDFPALQETMERELDALKKDVLILALPNVSISTIHKKQEVFLSQIKYYALLSAAVAIAPIPGLSIGVDLGLLVILLTTYVLVLGLDVKTLLKLSTTSSIPLADIEAEFKCLCSGKEIDKGLIITMLGSLSLMMSAAALEEGSRFIPFFGWLIAATVSYTSMVFFLKFVLDRLCDDATNVLKKVKHIK